jgi:hypothetical protein
MDMNEFQISLALAKLNTDEDPALEFCQPFLYAKYSFFCQVRSHFMFPGYLSKLYIQDADTRRFYIVDRCRTGQTSYRFSAYIHSSSFTLCRAFYLFLSICSVFHATVLLSSGVQTIFVRKTWHTALTLQRL